MKALDTTELWSPFQDPVLNAQSAFRLIMRALAEPGTLQDFSGIYPGAEGQSTLAASSEIPAAFTLALTLLDQDTAVWISPELQSSFLPANLRFYCGCALVEEPAQADFAFLRLAEWRSLEPFNPGSELHPHQSTTLILEVAGLGQGDIPGNAPALSLSGPGIPDTRRISIDRLTAQQLSLLQENHRRFPQGFELLLTCGSRMAAISRSTRIESDVIRENKACMSR